ncbi:Fukutin-related protein [Hypsibius exemplaris]|uniref:Fukutin-related protein n=1 Tax=Hypsibius exemplaris TaxID=2072580 RepID=A0A9X6NDX1_HYPEX|nr:Fukutin-related protein [Hypsibius exemplaris]
MISFLPRTQPTILLVFLGALLQYILGYFFWTSYCASSSNPTANHVFPFEFDGKITCIIRDFDSEASDLEGTSAAIDAVGEVARIVVVSERKLYPPVNSPSPKVVYFETQPSVRLGVPAKKLRDIVQTQWVLLLPDGVRPSRQSLYDSLRQTTTSNPAVKIWAFRVRGKRASCQSVRMDWKRWTLTMNNSAPVGDVCDAVTGSVVYLLRSVDFLNLPEPLLQPVGESLLVQSLSLGWKTHIFGETLFARSDKLLDPQMLAHQRSNHDDHVRDLYDRFQIKQTVKNGHVELFGCTKATPRCFGNVINDTPSYLYEGRWTPPCCINALKATLQHVIEVFDFNGVAYWLEGGSLLGAARNGQLIPWDYDIDLGMFLNETKKIQYLEAAREGPVADPDGFTWELAQPGEGQFYRVHYSRTNRLHVDIFPFYANNSVMTKDFWFRSHPQDREFPEDFLTPMESAGFLGLTVAVPNRRREFLELKFGKGCIENPKYPRDFKL